MNHKTLLTILFLLTISLPTFSTNRKQTNTPEPETNWGKVTTLKPAKYNDIDNFKTEKVTIRFNNRTGLVERVTNLSIINWFDVYIFNMFSIKKNNREEKHIKTKNRQKTIIINPR